MLADEVTNNNVLGLRSGERLPVINMFKYFPRYLLILLQKVSFSQICNRTPAISAVQDFNEGVACGRRDSRSPQNPR